MVLEAAGRAASTGKRPYFDELRVEQFIAGAFVRTTLGFSYFTACLFIASSFLRHMLHHG
jgi:hypothetical protein